jgi:hypothetical protein
MKLIIFFTVFTGAFYACHSLEPPKSEQRLDKKPIDSTKAFVRFISDTFKSGIIDRVDLIKKFDKFYEDRNGHFFIRSYGHQKSQKSEFQLVEVFVEIPRLDSATYKSSGSYLIDNSKVICVFSNSDGGSYVWLKDADPESFQAFKNAFGGKDKKHVFYQAKKLEGLNPVTVKVYSDTKNCTNCMPYLTDGNSCYFGEEKIEKSNCSIPPEYKFIE